MIAIVLVLAFLSGCDVYLPGPSYSEIEVPEEEFYQIETLELPEAEPNEAPLADANEAPPAELELSLEECRALALQNNLQLKAELINPTIAAERLSEEEAKFEASFFANANLSKLEQPGRTVVLGDGTLLTAPAAKTEQIAADLGVMVPLRTGGQVIFDLADNRYNDLTGDPNVNPTFDNRFSVSISQPLLRNAGNWANMHSIRLARYDRQAADARAKLEVITVLAAIDRVYWRLYAARKELDVRKQQYDLAQAQLEQAQRFVDLGERAQVEVTRAEAGVAQQLEAIIVAENNLRDRERELKRVINRAGLDMQSPTALVPRTEPDPILYQMERSELVRTALDSRMELVELQLQLLRDASTVDYMRNLALPLATLDYTYNISGTGLARSDSFDMLCNSDFTGHRLGAQLVIPIGNQAAQSRIRQAIYQRRQRLATRDDREAMIELEVLNAIDQVEANWQRILAARQNSILNGRLYEAEKRQFELGARTSTDVLDAQTTFANAQSAEITALTEYQIALVDLANATGTILGAAHIQWAPIVPAGAAP
ncbi:MAG: TolC family protein [Phycisphaerales bacterium]|nr:MAG: TolC family protein [Phycisphaerales bacterium]